MGKQDKATRAFMSINEFFADAFNAYFFKGKKVLMPDNLTPQDPSTVIADRPPEFAESADPFSERIRDILKRAVIRTDGHTRFVLLGIENQITIDPWMVVRCLEYDARSYRKQMDGYREARRRASNVAGASVWPQVDEALIRLCPVVSLVIYFGPDKWNAPRSLSELFGHMGDEYNPFALFAFDYHLHLIEPYRMSEQDFETYATCLREVLRLMKSANDRAALKQLLAQDERFRDLHPKAVDLINTCTSARIKYNETQRTVDMRSAFVEEREEGFAEGMAAGQAKGRAEGMAEGQAKGRAEGQNQEKCAIALRMLTEKLLDIPTIAKVTGLTLQQVLTLQSAQ